MSDAEIGWVLDQATSRRRLHLTTSTPGVVLLTLEVYGQASCVLELDEDGVVILRGLLGEALVRTRKDS